MQPDISIIASLIGDPTRAAILTALMGGKALTATELALEADITPQTASSHLNKLLDGQLLTVRKQGRHKYFQLHSRAIAELLESLLSVSSRHQPDKIQTGPSDSRLRQSRICYDHLAGEIGVAIYAALAQQQYIIDQGETTLLSDNGKQFFSELGIDFSQFDRSKRPLCKSCLDWSERTNHLAGQLGQWILNDILAKQWASKDLDSRAIQFSAQGLLQLKKRYGIALAL